MLRVRPRLPARARAPRLRRRALLLLQRALYGSGLSGLYASSVPNAGAMVLMYHDVSTREERAFLDPMSTIDLRRFEAQMRFLSRNRNVISMSQLAEILESGQTPPTGTVVVTFDDGYRSVLTYAAPVLKRYGLPATVYLATGFVERAENQWVDELYSLFRWRQSHELTLEELPGKRYQLDQRNQVCEAYRQLHDVLLRGTPQTRRRLQESLARQLRPKSCAPRLTLTWQEVSCLTAAYPQIEIGAHSHEHVDLTSLTPDQVDDDLGKCVGSLEANLGTRPVQFSYPYGRFDRRAAERLRALGFRTALATEPEGLVTAQSDPLALPRVSASCGLGRLAYVTQGAHPELSARLTGRF